MACLNKNHKGYKTIANKYGEAATEKIVRDYNKSNNTVDKFPTLSEVESYISKSVEFATGKLGMAMGFNPELPISEMDPLLVGLASKQAEGEYQILSNEWVERLANLYPNRFKIEGDILKVTEGTGSQGLYKTPNMPNPFEYSTKSLTDSLEEANISGEREALIRGIAETAEALSNQTGIKWEWDYEMDKRGRIRDGVVYLNPNKITKDTAVHEYLHPFIEAISQNNKTLYKSLVAQAKRVEHRGFSLYDQVRALNPELSEEDLIKETIVTAAGLIATDQLEETPANITFFDRLKLAILKLLQKLGLVGSFDLKMPLTYATNLFLTEDYNYDLREYAYDANQNVDNLREMGNDMVLVEEPAILIYQGEELEVDSYYLNTKTNAKHPRVSKVIIDPYDDTIYKNSKEKREEYKKEEEKNKAEGIVTKAIFQRELGTDGHWIMQSIIDQFKDEDGKLLDVFPTEDEVINTLQSLNLNENLSTLDYIQKEQNKEEHVHRLIEGPDAIALSFYTYAYNMLSSYRGKNVTIFTELTLGSEKKEMAGTIDLLVVGENTYDIYDWKTMDPNKWISGYKREKELIELTKENKFKLQGKAYKELLDELLPNHTLNRARFVPILIDIEGKQDGEYIAPEILAMADFNIDNIEREDYILYPVDLKPVDLSNPESVFLERLEALYKDVTNKAYSGSYIERAGKLNYATQLRKIYKELSVKGEKISLKNYSEILLTESQTLLNNSESVEGIESITEVLKQINKLNNKILSLGDPVEVFGEEEPIVHSIAKDINRATANIASVYKKLTIKAAESFDVENILHPDKAYGVTASFFKPMSFITGVKTIDLLNRVYQDMNQRYIIRRQQFVQKFQTLYKELEGSKHDHFKYFFQNDDKGKRTNRLIYKVDHDKVLAQFKDIVDRHNAAQRGLRELESLAVTPATQGEVDRLEDIIQDTLDEIYDLEVKIAALKPEYSEDKRAYEADLIKSSQTITLTAYEKADKTEEEILGLTAHKRKSYVEDKIKEWEGNNSLLKYKVTEGMIELQDIRPRYFEFNTDYVEANDLHSEDYKKLIENDKRKELYDMMMEINERAYKAGLIRNKSTFFPSKLSGNYEKLRNGNLKVSNITGPLKQFMDASVSDDFSSSPYEVDPGTGKKKYLIKTMYANDYTIYNETKDKDGKTVTERDYSAYSFDIFNVYHEYSDWLDRYETQTRLEPVSEMLLAIEKTKDTVLTNTFGTAMKDKFNTSLGLKTTRGNENLKLLEDLIELTVFNTTGINKKDLAIPTGNGKSISTSKVINSAMAMRSSISLGLSVTAGLSATFGASINTLFIGSKRFYYNNKDLARMTGLLTGSVFGDDKSKKAKQLLQDIQPVMGNLTGEQANRLSAYDLNKFVNSENLYILLSEPDKQIQSVNALAIMNNLVIDENGVPQFIPNEARKLIDYDTRAVKGAKVEDINKLDAELKDKIAELKKRSVLEKATTEDNHGLTEDQMVNIRLKIISVNKNVIGNLDPTDFMRSKNNMWWQMATQFKSWLPQLMLERFGAAEMTSQIGLQWGKYRTVGSLATDRSAQKKYKEFNKNDAMRYVQMAKAGLLFLKGGVSVLTTLLSRKKGQSLYDKMWEDYEYYLERHKENGKTEASFIGFGEFKALYIGNLRSATRDAFAALTLAATLFALTAAIKNADDDEEEVPRYVSAIMKQIDKFSGEVGVFYNPSTFIDMVKRPFAVTSVLTDFGRILTHTTGQWWNVLQQMFTGDETEDLERYKPMKYIYKFLPVVKEVFYWTTLLNEEVAKEHGVNINANNNRR